MKVFIVVRDILYRPPVTWSLFQLLVLSVIICSTLAAAPGWSIWQGGMWNIPDDDNDNIPGVGGTDYPVNGQKELCAINPTNPGC